MTREFIRTKKFEENWKDAGLNDNDLYELENILLKNPKAGVVIPSLSGGRKLRFRAKGKGKSSGVRVVYVDILVREHIYLLIAYPKNVQIKLSPEQISIVNNLILKIKEG
ncbi:MAG: addiction module toxin RelE [Oscillospiraceae bacterium]|jgi:hypothetical protein|nr:addiction module toxin RelE [Oscillospiraceae bacterium]